MTDSDTALDPHAVRGRLLRIFGLGFGLAVVIGGVIGSGIMRNPSVVAAGFLDPKLILLAWLGGGLFVAIDAMPTVELGAAIPQSGGPYPLAVRSIGPFTGFFVGWADWLQLVFSTGFIAVAFGEYVQRLGLLPGLTTGEIAILLVVWLRRPQLDRRAGRRRIAEYRQRAEGPGPDASWSPLCFWRAEKAAPPLAHHRRFSAGWRRRWRFAPSMAPMAAGKRWSISPRKCMSPSAMWRARLSAASRW